MPEDFISSDFADLQGLIHQLDLLDENVNRALRDTMHDAADMIEAEQKRCIAGDGKMGQRLAKHIRAGRVYATKKGAIGIAVGYQKEAFHEEPDGFNPGLLGMMKEFGRPGESPARSKSKMKQKRLRIPNKNAPRRLWAKAVPTDVEVDKGTIQPRPHIRRGFDNKKEQAVRLLVDAVEREMNKEG